MEQTVAMLANANNLTNTLVKPLVLKGVTLLSPGVWTGMDNKPTRYTEESILKGYEKTKWEDMNLFLDHKDTKDGSGVGSWIGFVRNPKVNSGKLVGDLEVWHPLIAMFLEKAKAKFAVSATMEGREELSLDGNSYDYQINSFKSMSVVDTPGCDEAWLPRLLSKGLSGDKTVIGGSLEEFVDKELAKVTDMEAVRKDKGMPLSEFYAVPNDPPSSSKLPIFDAEHTRKALAGFSQTQFNNPSQKQTAWNKIKGAAEKFGINISEDSDKKLERCKEVEKMEEKVEKTLETAEAVEAKAEVEEKALEAVSINDFKALQTEMSEIKEQLKGLASKFEESKELEAPSEEESEEESEDKKKKKEESEAKVEVKEESKAEEVGMSKELSSAKAEIEKLKKELSDMKEKAEAEPKTLAAGQVEEAPVDSNFGMIDFFKRNNPSITY